MSGQGSSNSIGGDGRDRRAPDIPLHRPGDRRNAHVPYPPPTDRRPAHVTGNVPVERRIPRAPQGMGSQGAATASGSTQQNLVLLGPIQEIQKAQNKLLTSVTESQRKILSAIEELKDMISDQAKAAFQIKGSHHELPLRREVARLFCRTLTRYPSSEEVTQALKKALPRGELEKRHVAETSLKEANSMLSVFRTEERRRVLGLKPVETLCKLGTASLARNLMEYMKATRSDELEKVYTRHLAILRLFVREVPEAHKKKNFHNEFKTWVLSTHASMDEDKWLGLMADDERHDYMTYPAEKGPDRAPSSDSPTEENSPAYDYGDDVGVNQDAYTYQ